MILFQLSPRILKDRDGKSKGVAYIKFSKTSEAAYACEAMNGECLGSDSRPLKVIVAASKSLGSSSRGSRDDEKSQRLFLIIPKGTTEKDLQLDFTTFGEIQDINMIRDRKTKDGKGFAYIRFKKYVNFHF